MDLWYIIKTSGIILLETLGIVVIYTLWKSSFDKDLKKEKRRGAAKDKWGWYLFCAIVTLLGAGFLYWSIAGETGEGGNWNGFIIFYLVTLVPGLVAVSHAHADDNKRLKYPSHWTDEQVAEHEKRSRVE